MLSNSLKRKGTQQESGEKMWQRDLYREHKLVFHLGVLRHTEANLGAMSDYTIQNAWMRSNFYSSNSSESILQVLRMLIPLRRSDNWAELSNFLEFWETAPVTHCWYQTKQATGMITFHSFLVLTRTQTLLHKWVSFRLCTATQTHLTDPEH